MLHSRRHQERTREGLMSADAPNGEPFADEPATIPTEAAEPTSSTVAGARAGRGRLVAWLGAGAAAAAIGIGIVVLVSSRSAGLDIAAGYVPADAVFYMEAQLDLPSGQRETLRGILERFPAATPDDLLGPALADTLDEALASGDAGFTYSGDIAPWFTGRVALSVNAVPDDLSTGSFSIPAMTFLLGTRDEAAAKEAVDKIRTSIEQSGGVTFSSADRGGTILWTVESPAGAMGPEATTLEIAVSGDQVILGINGGGGTALDVHAGKGDALSHNNDLAELIGRLPTTRVATMTVNSRAILEMNALPSPLPSALAAAIASTPESGVLSLSFEEDAVRMDIVSGPLPDGATDAKLASDLAAEIPGDALLFAEAPGVGEAIGSSVETLKATLAADPATSLVLDQLSEVESALGVKLEDYFDWAGGMAFAVGRDGDDAWGGLLVEVNDAAGAGQRIGQLDAFVALAASDPASGITVTHPKVAGFTFTSARIAVPIEAGLPLTGIVFEYGLADDRLLIGFGDSFIGRTLDLAAADSLASSAAYGRALDALGSDPAYGVTFVDLAASRAWAEEILPADVKAEYDREIGPNLEPLDYLAMGSRRDGRFVISTMLLTLN
jgi:hypothetical protein